MLFTLLRQVTFMSHWRVGYTMNEKQVHIAVAIDSVLAWLLEKCCDYAPPFFMHSSEKSYNKLKH